MEEVYDQNQPQQQYMGKADPVGSQPSPLFKLSGLKGVKSIPKKERDEDEEGKDDRYLGEFQGQTRKHKNKMIAGLGKKRGGTIKFMDTQQDEEG